MDLQTFFLRQHAAVHARDVSGLDFAVQRVFDEPSDEQMRIRPGKDSPRADVAAVRAYRSAVGLRTREVVQALRADSWDEIIGDEDIKRAGATGAFRDWVEGVRYPWLGLTRGDQLASSALRHNAAHIGEAVTVRGLAGLGL